MIPLAPSLVIAAANAFVGVGEQGGNNRGQMVEMFLREVHQEPGQPWCAAFVHHVGYWALYDHEAQRSSWPLQATASCALLGEDAGKHGILKDEPQFGDVFLLYKPALKRFGHTGFIERVRWARKAGARTIWTCSTIEGNTNAEGSREGDGTLRKVRDFCPEDGDRFIRWVDLELRKAA